MKNISYYVINFIRLRSIPVIQIRAVLIAWTAEPLVKKSKQRSPVWILPYLQPFPAIWLVERHFASSLRGSALLTHNHGALLYIWRSGSNTLPVKNVSPKTWRILAKNTSFWHHNYSYFMVQTTDMGGRYHQKYNACEMNRHKVKWLLKMTIDSICFKMT